MIPTNHNFALFAFGRFYPSGGVGDLRGTFETVEEARKTFQTLIPVVKQEMGFSGDSPFGDGDCYGHIVDLKTLGIVEELNA